MSSPTRREFLATTALGAAGVALAAAPGTLFAVPSRLARSAAPAYTYFPTPMGVNELQSLALRAMDAARAAGAAYADVRVAEEHDLNLRIGLSGPETYMHSRFSYGIRVLVNGAWAFMHGNVPAADAVTRVAQDAVATARGYASLNTRAVELVPAPAPTGSWTSPVKIDPFTIPLADQIDLLYTLIAASTRVLGGGGRGEFNWGREVRTFASTEGALITQTTCRSRPKAEAAAARTLLPGAFVSLVDYGPTMGGYETVLIPDLQEQIKAATEEASRLSTLTVRELDVGRYPIVVDGFTLGALFGQTIGHALELDRALGNEADATGASFITPPADMLGRMVINPLLNVTGSRVLPSVNAVQWDDEGVVPSTFPLLTDGTVVDYWTSRDYAGALRSWYESRGVPVQSHGCAVAATANDPVQVRAPHLTIAPGTGRASLADLCKDVSHGVLMTQTDYIAVDQELTSGSVMWGHMFEIERGKIVRRLRDTGLQFTTQKLWKSLMALGDQSTVRNNHYGTYKGNPWKHIEESTTAPAGLFKDVDVIATGARLV
jgi:TldD protein